MAAVEAWEAEEEREEEEGELAREEGSEWQEAAVDARAEEVAAEAVVLPPPPSTTPIPLDEEHPHGFVNSDGEFVRWRGRWEGDDYVYYDGYWQPNSQGDYDYVYYAE